jgi:hypothetical protein
MKKLKHYLLATVGFLFFVGALTLVVTRDGHGGSSPARQSDGIDLTVMEPYQESVTATLIAGESGKNVGIAVPAGKLFVVEQVSAYGSAPSDQRINLSVSSHIAPDLSNRSHYLLAERQTVNGTTYYRSFQTVKIYGDTPSITARVERSIATDSVTFRFTVSGYFVNK